MRRTWCRYLQWISDQWVETTNESASHGESTHRGARAGQRRRSGATVMADPRRRRGVRARTSDDELGSPSDEALLAGMSARDEESTVAFVRRYQRRVFGLAVGILHDRGAAEDVAQEVMLRAWRHAPVFDSRRGSVENWVLTIARNLSIDALRRQRSIPTDPDILVALARTSSGSSINQILHERRTSREHNSS